MYFLFDQNCRCSGCFKTMFGNQSNNGVIQKDTQPYDGNIVWTNAYENDNIYRGISQDDSFGMNQKRFMNSHLTFPPIVSDEIEVIHDMHNATTSISISSCHQPQSQKQPPDCRDCRTEVMDLREDHIEDQIDVTTGMGSR